MVSAEFLCLPVDASHRSGVTRISTIDELGCDKHDISSASSMRILKILGSILLFHHFFLDVDHLLSALLRS